MRSNHTAWIVVAALLMVFLIDRYTWATRASGYIDALVRGFTQQGTSGASDDMVANAGCWDGNTWERASCAAGGAVVVAECATTTVNQITIGTSSTAVPTTAQTNRASICIFNLDDTDTAYCDDGTATTGTGWPIRPDTWKCFGAEAVQCISDGSALTGAYQECGP